MSTSIDGTHAQGFLLLTIPNCTLSTPTTPTQTGTLALQCVTLDVPSDVPDRDVWLVLKLNAFEMAVSPTQMINYSRTTYTYMFLPENERSGLVQLIVPPNPANPASYEDLETMEVILSQYGVVHDIEAVAGEKGKGPFPDKSAGPVLTSGPGTSDLKGRLVLMDEDDGEVVATLDEAVPIKEDKGLAAEGHEKDPVVIDLPGEEEERAGHTEAYAHPASPEEQDMLMKTAGLISRGIILATSALTTGMTSASNYYISRSNPTAKPVEFSPRARANIRRIHNISGTAVTVTSKTTGAILRTLDHVAGSLAGPGNKAVRASGLGSRPQLAPPRLPPRPGSPGGKSPSSPGGAYPGSPGGTYPGSPGGAYPGTPPPLPPRNPRLLNRLLASTDLLLTTLERSATQLIEGGTNAISASLAHKYGQDMGDASQMAGRSARNVGLVYIDVRGVGRRALLKRAGKAVVKARMGGREVVLGPQAQEVQPSGPYPSGGAPSTSSLPAYSPASKGSIPIGDNRFKKE